MGEKASLPARAGLRGAHSPVQVVACGARGPLGGGCGVLREPGKAETHIARLRGPGPLAGGDDLCLLRARHGRGPRGHGKEEQGEPEREKGDAF